MVEGSRAGMAAYTSTTLEMFNSLQVFTRELVVATRPDFATRVSLNDVAISIDRGTEYSV
jgi:hypothetical protein